MRKAAFPVFVGVLIAWAVAHDAAQTPQPPRKVLFIGDSLTYFNDGIYAHLERLAAAAKPVVSVTADKSVAGGAFLRRLWDMQGPVKAIGAASYDAVLLQEDLPETTVADFHEYARRFVTEIRKTRARPILLMAWAYPRLGWISMEQIAAAHRDVARELNVEVAPVGLAWQAVSNARPSLNLFGPDHEHPNIHGTYLATCVVYSTLYKRDPNGIAYVASGMTAEDAAFLQKIAWQIVQNFK
jgi:hypothetical protein